MRTISSFTLVGEVAAPVNWSPDVGAGKRPALSSAVAFGLIMQVGIVFPGNGEPCTMPAGRTSPGQFFARTDGATCAAVGTSITVPPKSPPYVDGSGTGCPLLTIP